MTLTLSKALGGPIPRAALRSFLPLLRSRFAVGQLTSFPVAAAQRTPVPAPELLISVIVPTYNYAHVLPRALDSVISQWGDDIELLVIDDGSDDHTPDVLQRYTRRFAGCFQIVRQDNAGAAAARNRGVRAARGAYVLMLDADDELLPDAFKTLREALRSTPSAAMVLGAQVSVYADGSQRVRLPTPVTGTPVQRCRRYLLQKRISISHSRCLFRRDLLLQRPYPETLRSGEDVAVFAYVLVSGSAVTTTHPLARVYKHRDSLRHSRADEESVAQGMLHEVFAQLPDECQRLRQRYAAQRYLSLFRAALVVGDGCSARRFYRQAVTLSCWQALRPGYLSKLLRIGWR